MTRASASLYVQCRSGREARQLARRATLSAVRWQQRTGDTDALGFVTALDYPAGCPPYVQFLSADALLLLARWPLWTKRALPVLLPEIPEP